MNYLALATEIKERDARLRAGTPAAGDLDRVQEILKSIGAGEIDPKRLKKAMDGGGARDDSAWDDGTEEDNDLTHCPTCKTKSAKGGLCKKCGWDAAKGKADAHTPDDGATDIEKGLAANPALQGPVQGVPVIQAFQKALGDLARQQDRIEKSLADLAAQNQALVAMNRRQTEEIRKSLAEAPAAGLSSQERQVLEDTADSLQAVIKGLADVTERVERRPFSGNPSRSTGATRVRDAAVPEMTYAGAIGVIQKALDRNEIKPEVASRGLEGLEVKKKEGPDAMYHFVKSLAPETCKLCTE